MTNNNNDITEAALVASVLTDPKILVIVQEMVPAGAIQDPIYSTIYRAAMSVQLSQRKVDPVTLAAEMVRLGSIKYIGSKREAVQIMRNLKDEHGLGAYQDYAATIRDSYAGRQFVDGMREVATEVRKANRDLAPLLDDAIHRIHGVSALASYKPAVHVEKLTDIVLEELAEAKENPGGPPGITTGWEELDAFFKFVPGRIYFIAARPGNGKTSVMMNMVTAAADEGHNPYVQTLEMSGVEVIERVVYTRANVALDKGKAGETTDAEDERICEQAEDLAKRDIYVDDAANLTPQDIRARIVEGVRRHGSNIAFVDHLHEVAKRKTGFGERMDDKAHIGEAVVVLADLAKEMNIPIVVMAQMNRNIESKKRRPQKSDLKGSGKIEERAYIIMFLHPRNDKSTEAHVSFDFIINKNRTGQVGDVPMVFEKDRGQFVPHIETEPDVPLFRSHTETEKDEQ